MVRSTFKLKLLVFLHEGIYELIKITDILKIIIVTILKSKL